MRSPSFSSLCGAAPTTITAVVSLLLTTVPLVSANSVDTSNASDLGKAVSAVVTNLVGLYDSSANSDGGWDEDTYSWFASGMAWGTVFSMHKITGNAVYDSTAGNAISLATFGTTGDLLGGSLRSTEEKLFGKWNDDIVWWAISMMEAIDIYGVDEVIPDGTTFLSAAELTWNEVWEQYDVDNCGGGIYWSRDRDSSNSNQVTYKSTITNVEFIELSARLAIATSNSTYSDAAAETYTWLKTIGFIDSSWTIIDGGNAPTCTSDTRIDSTQWSYNYGLAISGLVFMYNATGDSSYLSDAKSIFGVAVGIFTSSNIIYELCEAASNCGRDVASYKMQFYKMLRHYYSVADDTDKATIKTILDATMTQATYNCDSSWWCDWHTDAGVDSVTQGDAYGQMAVAELMLSASYVYGASDEQGGDLATSKSSADFSAPKTSITLAGLAVIISVLINFIF